MVILDDDMLDQFDIVGHAGRGSMRNILVSTLSCIVRIHFAGVQYNGRIEYRPRNRIKGS